jgi:hypothetical protein
MPRVLYHRRSRPTGAILGEALGIPHGTTVPDDERADVLIRWGAAQGIPLRARNTLNRRDAITNATEKLQSLQIMQAAGVPVPPFAANPAVLRAPFLGRNRNHARGTDIVLCMQQGDVERNPRDYYVEYVPTARELRIHVFRQEVIYCAEKLLTNPAAACPYIRNHAHGYTFRQFRNLGTLQEAAAISAVRAHGLDFGAVDLIIADDGQTWILEVNTAPACAPLTGRKYVDAIARWMEEQHNIVLTPNYEVLERLAGDDEEEMDA